MKSSQTLRFVVALALFACLSANAAVLFTEEYPTAYGDGTALGSGVTTGGYNTKWPAGNSAGAGNPICTSLGALTYGPLAPIAGSASYGFRCATAASRDQSGAFATQSGNGNSVYLSFLIQVTAATPVDRILIGLRNSTGGGTLVAAVGVNTSRQLVLFKSNTAATMTTAALTQNQTYLVVLRYTFLAGADECAMWLNPATGGADEASASMTPIVTTSGSDQSALLSLRIESDADTSEPLYLDEFRVGTAWADVTPSGGPVVGEKLGFTSPPATAQVNSMLNSVVVQVQGVSGTAAASNGVPVTVALTSGSGVLSGTLTQNSDANGAATFGDLSIDTLGNDKQLTATASGIGAGLASVTSGAFSIVDTPVLSGLVITEAAKIPAGFKVAGITEQPGVFTQILGSSDPGRPKTNWVIVAYQTSSPNAVVTFTNPVSPALPHAFYALRTGNVVTKLEPPSIGLTPQSQIVSPGTTATFAVTATGPQLQYLWFFNSNPIPGATNATLLIPNAQAGNVGSYYVAVANPAGNVNTAVATLGVANVAPSITAQPQNQTNNAGGTAIFSAAATGTSPLNYQWYFNTTTPVPGGTNPVLTLNGITTNEAGQYRVTVTNAFGGANSSQATLTVTPVPTGLPDTNIVGWAAYKGVTGGAGGTEITVSDYPALRAACRAAGPLIIRVEGAITPNESYCYIEGADKTIVGVGTNAGLYGAGFRVNASNIIIANLYFSATNSNSDGVTIDYSSSHGLGNSVWVDHCTFYDCTDGSVDVTKGADYVTVSWCKFYYAPVPPGTVTHEFVNLLGSSDDDNGANYHVTFHHNWYGDYCRERMPSVRFGRAHVFNNYYDCVDNNYCVRTRLDAEVLVENNYFLGVQNPWERFVTGTPGSHPGWLKATGNITNNCTFVNGWTSGWTSGASVIPGNDDLGPELDPPPYSYTLTPANDVPYYIQTYSGSGKYPYVP